MNATEQARQAYAPAYSPVSTARSAEYRVLSDVTVRLRKARDAGAAGFVRLAEAIHDNRVLWSVLAADVSDKDNGLSQELRARIFYLSEFTVAHSRAVLRGEADVGPLIDINAAVLRGLSGQTTPRGAA